MADMVTAAVGANSAPSTKPVGEQDFAQIRPVAPQPVDKVLTPAEKEEQKEQQPLFAPGTVPEETVSQITDAFNELMDKIDCNLELNYNKEANMINVKVVDKDSGKVIREFPSEEMLENMIKAEQNAENSQQMRGVFVNRMV